MVHISYRSQERGSGQGVKVPFPLARETSLGYLFFVQAQCLPWNIKIICFSNLWTKKVSVLLNPKINFLKCFIYLPILRTMTIHFFT